MNTVRSTGNVGDGLKGLLRNIRSGRTISRGAAWGMIIIAALLAFEVFNYSTTQFALRDVLGDLTFAGLRWATILAIAFCGIDFAGIARIFTPQQGRDEPAEVWYLFGAWLLAAAFNAALTWWGVSVAIVNHSSAAAGSVVSGHTLTKLVPIFVAAMVLLIRCPHHRDFLGRRRQPVHHGRRRHPRSPATVSAAPPAGPSPVYELGEPGARPAHSFHPASSEQLPTGSQAPGSRPVREG